MRPTLGILLALLVAAPAAAQDEAALRRAFEGRTVTVRLDMPATSRGVDVYPQDGAPLDAREVAERLKEFGPALRIGQRVMVTKVVVKKNSHVEFQLGGGGYGTLGDWSGSDVTPAAVGESRAERALRDSVKSTGDRALRTRLQRDLDALRAARERENARAAAEAQQANVARETLLRARRAEAGSRFNVRYRGGLPAEALTPDGVTRALAAYVDFEGAAASGAAPAAKPAAAPGVAGLRKGLLLEEVEALLGPAATAAESREGTLTLVRRTYRKDGVDVAARFVSGVLIDFAITSR
ncbi:hypothetical protein [Roseisolibacter sp. H3M3-2]|uniref:hypothetical protein n=1 Tax=Roseisolibacter sp. H3M3-2 TaxID=3031323 RepID=UPI0023DC7B84|nr:hypothetical protein [Roseisolibacter sp. H3M3-2]MDF1501639.1 hypothetical protein [Roseisolibacter sp. H3M3-2]